MNTRICEMYEKYKTGIFRYILSITNNPELAEDVLQDTFVQLLTDGFCFAPGKERAWLFKVARNKCFNILKRQRKQVQMNTLRTSSLNHHWEFIEMISSLSAPEQEIVTLKIIGGFSHKEIARITGSTAAATQKKYERAVKKLRDEMEELI